MYNFEFAKPTTLADAEKALKADGAQALSGGQTLIPTLKQRLAQPEVLVSLRGIDELKGVKADKSNVTIGAATTHAEVAREAGSYPALATLAGNIGDPSVRNMGTIGGSLANNDPSACYPAAALASGATITTNKRDIAADDYFQGLFETALDEGEIITKVTFPVPKKAAYVKFLQPASRFALVGVFAAETSDGLRIAVTGASNDGVFLYEQGSDVDADDMISDLHGTGAYRAHLVKVITERAIAAMA